MVRQLTFVSNVGALDRGEQGFEQVLKNSIRKMNYRIKARRCKYYPWKIERRAKWHFWRFWEQIGTHATYEEALKYLAYYRKMDNSSDNSQA